MSSPHLTLMAHLMRRAGFGATRDELEDRIAKGYEATVEELLHPGDPESLPDDIIRRYHVDLSELRHVASAVTYWLYRMVTTASPLEEKITLFWHDLFATGERKVNNSKTVLRQIHMLRRHCLGRFPKLLVELSKDPAMIYWLDNIDNHSAAINENYGRELLELFSLGSETTPSGTSRRLREHSPAGPSRTPSIWPSGLTRTPSGRTLES